MKVLLQIGVILLLAALGFVAGGLVGARFVPEDAGFQAGATVFLWAAGGTLVGLVAGGMAASRLSRRD